MGNIYTHTLFAFIFNFLKIQKQNKRKNFIYMENIYIYKYVCMYIYIDELVYNLFAGTPAKQEKERDRERIVR